MDGSRPPGKPDECSACNIAPSNNAPRGPGASPSKPRTSTTSSKPRASSIPSTPSTSVTVPSTKSNPTSTRPSLTSSGSSSIRPSSSTSAPQTTSILSVSATSPTITPTITATTNPRSSNSSNLSSVQSTFSSTSTRLSMSPPIAILTTAAPQDIFIPDHLRPSFGYDTPTTIFQSVTPDIPQNTSSQQVNHRSIVAGVLGALLVMSIVCGLIFYMKRRARLQRSTWMDEGFVCPPGRKSPAVHLETNKDRTFPKSEATLVVHHRSAHRKQAQSEWDYVEPSYGYSREKTGYAS